MSTNDVPGANADNDDELAMGCWAEHSDGSLIFVESTEADRVIYSMFDMSRTPPVEYRDAMPTEAFEDRFGRDGDVGPWTWHDKTPFDWNRIIKAGGQDGPRHAFADHTRSAAERVADSLRLRGDRVSADINSQHRRAARAGRRVDGPEQTIRRAGGIWDKLSRAIAELGK